MTAPGAVPESAGERPWRDLVERLARLGSPRPATEPAVSEAAVEAALSVEACNPVDFPGCDRPLGHDGKHRAGGVKHERAEWHEAWLTAAVPHLAVQSEAEVRADEREKCAQVVDRTDSYGDPAFVLSEAARMIRARTAPEGGEEAVDQCRHGELDTDCLACAACAACDGSCGTCPYAQKGIR